MRADGRKPRASIGISGVFQRFGKPLGNLRFCLRTAKRRVRKRDFLPVFRDTPVNFRRTRLQIFAERSALLYDLRAEQNKALVPNIKRIDKLMVTRNILKNSIALH